MNLFTLFRGCLLILAGSSAGLELNISIRDIVERDGAQKLATWGPILWKSPPNHAILVQLLECPWADLRKFLRPSEDAETFEALKLIATEARYKNIRDRLLTAENVANNTDFLRWAVRDGNYVPKDSLASSKVPVGSMETFTIITDALSNIPEQRNKATSLGNIYDFLFEIRDPGQFQECYSRIKNLGGPTLFVNALLSWDRIRGASDELFEEVVIKALKEDTTVFTPSRLLIYLARSSRIPEEGNRRYRKYCMLKDLLLLGQAEPEWNLLLEGARNPNSDLEAMRAAAQRLVENRVRVEGAMTPSLSMSILCIYAPVFQKARSMRAPQIIKIKIIEELHDEIKIKLLLKGVSIPGMQVDMKLDIPAAQVDMKLNIPTVQVHRQLNIPAMQVDMKLDIPAVQVHRKLNIPAMQVYRELNIPVVQVSKELKPFSCVSELSKALNLDSLVKEFYKNSGISTDLPLHTVLSCIEDAEGQRKVYLRSQVEIPCEDRELVDEKDTPLTVDEQVELLLREDLGDLTVLRKKWRFSKPQPLNDGKYAEMAHDLAFNYLEAALAEPGYLWDAEYKITCQENTIKRWNAFFKALPVLLLRGKRLPKIGRLFRKDIFGNYTLREAETLARDWDEESDSMRTLWEELRYAFEDTALSWGSKLIELIVQEGDLVDDGQIYE